MTTGSVDRGEQGGDGPQMLRPPGLDAVDRRILRELVADARITNADLAQRVGVAPSTCLGRVRALRERGVIRGFHADVDPAALGHDLQAMVAVRIQGDHRGAMHAFVEGISAQEEVLDVYFVAGADDYLLHVATSSTEGLRRFVAEHLSRHPAVARTETSLIFEHTRAASHRG